MSAAKTFTITMPQDEFYELCNLVQLIAVIGIELYMQGIDQPNKELLMRTFERLARAEADPVPNASIKLQLFDFKGEG